MLVAQRKHLAASTSTSPSAKSKPSGSPHAVTPSKRPLNKSQQMSPIRTAPRQTGTPTSLSQQQRPHTSPLRQRKPVVSVTSATPTKVRVAPATSSASHKTLTERSKVRYLTMDELHRAYAFDYKVGSGNWASVWRVTQSGPTGKVKAAKLVDREDGRAARQRCESLMREFKCLRSIPPTEPWHPSIINFDDLLLTPRYLCLIMPYYEHPMQVCVPLSTCRNYFEKLASAVSWLHRHYITHNDIKLVNTVVRVTDEDWDGTPVIVDFGFSTMHHPWRGTNFITTATWGTPEYLSPERVAGRPHDERLSDIWALGVTFFEIATGRTPFERQDETFITESTKNEYYRRVTAGEWIIDEDSEYVPWELEDLCRCMLELDPCNRAALQDIVQHEFFSPHGSDSSHQTSFLAAFHEDDDVDEQEDQGLSLSLDRRRGANQQKQRPFPSPARREKGKSMHVGAENIPPSPTSTPLKTRKKVLQMPTPKQSPKKQQQHASALTGYSPNVPAPFQPVHGSPLRQALQNAASRSNIQAQVAHAQHDRQLTDSTLGNHGSLDVSPVKKTALSCVVYDSPSTSPVKKAIHARVPSTSLIPQPIRQVRSAVNIDDASHFDSDTESDSESESGSERESNLDMDDDDDGDDEEEADVSHTSSDSDSDSDLASIIDLDDSPRRLAQTSPSSSEQSAPPGYTSTVAPQNGSVDDVQMNQHSAAATDEEQTIRPQVSDRRPSAMVPANLSLVIESSETFTREESNHQQEETKHVHSVDIAVQTEPIKVEIKESKPAVAISPNLTATLDEIHLLGFHLLAKVQQARKLLEGSATMAKDASSIKAMQPQPTPCVIDESLLSTQLDTSRLDTSCLSLVSALAQPQASTPTRTRKRKDPCVDVSQCALDIASCTPSSHSISTSRMGLREEMSWSTFGVVRGGDEDEVAAGNEDDAAITAGDEQTPPTTPSQENLQREIAAMHSRSRSLFSILDDLRQCEGVVDDQKIHSTTTMAANSSIVSLRDTTPESSTETLGAGIHTQGQGLAFEREAIPAVAMSPLQSRCTSPSLLQRGMSTLRKRRPREILQQQHQHHARAFSASSLLSFSPTTQAKSGLWRKLRGVGVGVGVGVGANGAARVA